MFNRIHPVNMNVKRVNGMYYRDGLALSYSRIG